MAAEQENTIFRKKTMDKISSPDQLTDYLRVTNPGIWAVLAAVILLLGGLFAWAAVGTLETTVDAKAVVRDHIAEIVPTGRESTAVASGMVLRIASEEYRVASVSTDAYGRTAAMSVRPPLCQ